MFVYPRLNSMIEQQVKKATECKGKEADVHVIDQTPEGPRGVISTYTTPNAQPYSNKFCQLKHHTEHSIKGEGPIQPDIPR